MREPDLLLPINKRNRKERFLVEYDGFMKNMSEGIIYNMIFHYDEYIQNYPQLKLFKNMNSHDLYDETFLYSPGVLMYYISNASDDIDIGQDLSILMNEDTTMIQEDVLTNYALRQIAIEEFTEKIDIINTYGFREFQVDDLIRSFGNESRKLNFFDGDPTNMILNGNYTSIFVNTIDTIENVYNENSEKLKDTLILLRNCDDNIILKGENSINYSKDSRLDKYTKEGINIGRVFTTRVNLSQPINYAEIIFNKWKENIND